MINIFESEHEILVSPAYNDPQGYVTDWFIIPIKVNSNHRPKFGKGGARLDKGYKEFRKILTIAFLGNKVRLDNCTLDINIPKLDYFGLEVIAYFPLTKKEIEEEKEIVHGQRMRRDPDCSNLVKGIEDSLQEARVLYDDNIISDLLVRKRYNCKTKDYGFKLRLFGYEK